MGSDGVTEATVGSMADRNDAGSHQATTVDRVVSHARTVDPKRAEEFDDMAERLVKLVFTEASLR